MGKRDSLVSSCQSPLTLHRCLSPLLPGWFLSLRIRRQIGEGGADLLKPPGGVNFYPLPCPPQTRGLGTAGLFLSVCVPPVEGQTLLGYGHRRLGSVCGSPAAGKGLRLFGRCLLFQPLH